MRALVSEIETSALITGLHTGHSRIDKNVLMAVAQTPRARFLSRKFAPYAYQNVAIPIFERGYVTPEPFLSAMMVQLMEIKPRDKVLEVGFGTGYETALLSALARKVYSVRQNTLINVNGLAAEPPLEKRGYSNVRTKDGNGLYGWKSKGPYDAILVKQSLAHPPAALIAQLKVGGRIVIPIDNPDLPQQRLIAYTKQADGSLSSMPVLYLKISPLLKGREI